MMFFFFFFISKYLFKDIDEIVLGKKTNNNSEPSEWKQCFDETTQAIYYWNTKTNDCSWDPPPSMTSENHLLDKSTKLVHFLFSLQSFFVI
jgi:hypothetical protein